MKELTVAQAGVVSVGVSQDTAIDGNFAIAAIGVAVAGATAPVWFPLAMIGVSVRLTASYFFNTEEQWF